MHNTVGFNSLRVTNSFIHVSPTGNYNLPIETISYRIKQKSTRLKANHLRFSRILVQHDAHSKIFSHNGMFVIPQYIRIHTKKPKLARIVAIRDSRHDSKIGGVYANL